MFFSSIFPLHSSDILPLGFHLSLNILVYWLELCPFFFSFSFFQISVPFSCYVNFFLRLPSIDRFLSIYQICFFYLFLLWEYATQFSLSFNIKEFDEYILFIAGCLYKEWASLLKPKCEWSKIVTEGPRRERKRRGSFLLLKLLLWLFDMSKLWARDLLCKWTSASW